MTDEDMAAVQDVIAEIDRRPIADLTDMAQRRKSHLSQMITRMLRLNITSGQADDSWRGTVVVSNSLSDHKEHVKKIANDICYLTDTLREAVAHYYETGTAIAPYPAMRICVNLRKAKAHALEIDFLRALLTKFPSIPNAVWFERRLRSTSAKLR